MSQNHGPLKVGFLYPGYAAEDDYPLMGQLMAPPVGVELVHTEFFEDAHTVTALSEMGGTSRIIAGARKLVGTDVRSVLWTSTSASFVLGLKGVRAQIAALEAELKVPASTTAMAFVQAAKAIGAKRVAIAATYPEDIALLFKAFLESFHVEVLQWASRGIVTAAEVGTLDKEQVVSLAVEQNHADADAILIPDTALHSAAWVEDLEQAVQKPVLTANLVSFWEAMRLTGQLRPQAGLGALFRSEPPVGYPG